MREEMEEKEERLQKFIASTGLCSRRKADELIAEGKIKVNGEIGRASCRERV